ncbi:DUF6498-containing protein [Luteimonas abyssi]|uniref:DUF6498-containing protein n=1 Tax=Luteimonas abyssi TaxID=1247514 RepID=UPI000737BE85|nr:DUF6498-containing protein [Luteimonas abyssi]
MTGHPTPPPSTSAPAGSRYDPGLLAILLGNALTLVVALWQRWSMLDLLWPFFFQSLIIGWYARRRLLLAPLLTVGNLRINGRQVTDPEQARRFFRWFFVAHYGLFHLAYAVFLLLMTARGSANADTDGPHWPLYLLLSLAFWWAHRLSHREHLARDTGRPRSASLLMIMPYLRILPMHITIIAMAERHGGQHEAGIVLLFMGLKTVADVGAHVIEHRLLRR